MIPEIWGKGTLVTASSWRGFASLSSSSAPSCTRTCARGSESSPAAPPHSAHNGPRLTDWEWMNGSENLILRFTSRPSQTCNSQRIDAGHSVPAVVFLSVGLNCFVLLSSFPPDQERNKVISAQTFTGLMSYIDNVVVHLQHNTSLHSD